ncbi:M23 family metallopeptidase [Inediibacterium massiliense]|uniref:M23 family metallopeptidase n=1 Tax=Inediibacterium massiliense TaxID=1658111 RepID=UPI0006B4C0CA|nr:M23 family metallopeptidase [Inediibacterium massiliense]
MKKFTKKVWSKEGFYIILFLCVCIVGTVSAWVTKEHIDQVPKEEVKEPSMTEEMDDFWQTDEKESASVIESVNEPQQVSAEKDQTQIIESKPVKENIVKEDVKEESKEEKIESIALPVKGKKGMDYAAEKLVYSKTLEQYTTHDGIDLIAPLNTPVVAALKGKVVEITEDPKLGTMITISHDDDVITRYANLSTTEMVKVGDLVRKGQVISGIGKTALFESSEEPHLHFEILVDGKTIDPSPFLPIKKE